MFQKTIAARFRRVFLLPLVLLFTTFLFSQPGTTSPESEPKWDTLRIRWSNTVWFGRSNFKVESFGSGKYKSGISSSSHKMLVNGQEELLTKTGFRLELTDPAGQLCQARGERYASSGQWVEDNFSLVEMLIPGVEEETYVADPVDVEILEAELWHPSIPDLKWKLHLKRNQSDGHIAEELDGFLSSGERIIQIRGPVLPLQQLGQEAWESGFYEFLENGRIIGKMTWQAGIVCFPQQTPMATRSLLLSVAAVMH